MRDATIYHRRAAECRELAEHSASAAHRATWRELELLWMRLAAESERRDRARRASDPGTAVPEASAAREAGVGTVVFVCSEPDLRHKDGSDAGSGPAPSDVARDMSADGPGPQEPITH